MSPPNSFGLHHRDPRLLRGLVLDSSLCSCIGEVAEHCTRLTHLRIGHEGSKHLPDGAIWKKFGGSINELNDDFVTQTSQEMNSDDEEDDFANESLEEDDEYELDIRHISDKLRNLESLHIGAGLQLKHQPVDPASLDQLIFLKELRLNPLRPGLRCDRSRDERNLRVLAQSSTRLRILDLRGCYLRILSLGWLKTQCLQALHMYYQVPAASVLFRWSETLKYVTLAKISARYRPYRSLGPEEPGEELDACLLALATHDRSQLLQLDIQESDCSLIPLQNLIKACYHLHYLNTLNCSKLDHKFRAEITSREKILNLFVET